MCKVRSCIAFYLFYSIVFMIHCSTVSGKSLRESSREFWDTLKMMWFPRTSLVTAGEFVVVFLFTFFHLCGSALNMYIVSCETKPWKHGLYCEIGQVVYFCCSF